MRIPRFFPTGADMETVRALAKKRPDIGTQFRLSEDDLIKQVRTVLRLGVGNRLNLLDGLGNLYEVEILQFAKSEIICSLVGHKSNSLQTNSSQTNSMAPLILVAQSLIKNDRFEWCLEKLTELGVDFIQPITSQHGVIKTGDWHDPSGNESRKLENRLKRWHTIVRESSEQCERWTIPQVVVPLHFDQYISKATPFGDPSEGQRDLRLICAERGKVQTIFSLLTQKISNEDPINSIRSISFLIGPEGGFSEKEFELAESNGWLPVSLGPRILRSETAAMVAVSQTASILNR